MQSGARESIREILISVKCPDARRSGQGSMLIT